MDGRETMVPYVVFESATSRQERTIKRLWILCIMLVLLLVGSNAGWIWYESQFEDVVTTSTEEYTQDVTQNSDGGGYNYFVGRDYYGHAESETGN